MPAAPLENRPLGGDEPALRIAALEFLERPHDPDVGVARPLAATLLADLEVRVDAPAPGRL